MKRTQPQHVEPGVLQSPVEKMRPADRRHIGSCPVCQGLLWLERGGVCADVCPDIDELVDAHMSCSISAELQRHLAACGDCRFELDGLDRVEQQLRPLPGLPAGSTAAPSLLDWLRRLIPLEMPLALPLAVRGSSANANAEPENALADYRAGRFAEACDGLQEFARSGGRSTSVDLYLAACLLRSQQIDEALAVLRPAVSAQPRSDELRWLLIQTLLRKGLADAAIVELDALSRRRLSPRADIARKLAQQLRERLRLDPV